MNEVEKEEIKKLQEDITDIIYTENEKAFAENCDALCSATEYLGTKIAEALYNAGYHKQVWHKVTDGDLPDYCKLVTVLVKDHITNQNIILSSSRHDNGFGHDLWLGEYEGCEVIAWTELPEYTE